jgi:hypothetical protein
MSRNVKTVKNSLKFKAQPKSGILTVRVGVKKYVLPMEARILTSPGHIFLSFPASSELYEIKNKGLAPMNPTADATAAYAALNPGRKKRTRKTSETSMPAELASALSKIPAGFKLGYDASGKPRLVKKRTRKATAAKKKK